MKSLAMALTLLAMFATTVTAGEKPLIFFASGDFTCSTEHHWCYFDADSPSGERHKLSVNLLESSKQVGDKLTTKAFVRSYDESHYYETDIEHPVVITGKIVKKLSALKMAQ